MMGRPVGWYSDSNRETGTMSPGVGGFCTIAARMSAAICATDFARGRVVVSFWQSVFSELSFWRSCRSSRPPSSCPAFSERLSDWARAPASACAEQSAACVSSPWGNSPLGSVDSANDQKCLSVWRLHTKAGGDIHTRERQWLRGPETVARVPGCPVREGRGLGFAFLEPVSHDSPRRARSGQLSPAFPVHRVLPAERGTMTCEVRIKGSSRLFFSLDPEGENHV